jgi:hypothetical protein
VHTEAGTSLTETREKRLPKHRSTAVVLVLATGCALLLAIFGNARRRAASESASTGIWRALPTCVWETEGLDDERLGARVVWQSGPVANADSNGDGILDQVVFRALLPRGYLFLGDTPSAFDVMIQVACIDGRYPAALWATGAIDQGVLPADQMGAGVKDGAPSSRTQLDALLSSSDRSKQSATQWGIEGDTLWMKRDGSRIVVSLRSGCAF